MTRPDTITDKTLWELMERIQRDRILLRFEIAPVSISGLTNIRGIRKFWSSRFFRIDAPESLWETAPPLKTLGFFFEFTGLDGLRYRFRTQGGRRYRNDVWIGFPRRIERIQQRENFRLEVEDRARLVCSLDGRRWEMPVLNLSEGGVFACWQAAGDDSACGPPAPDAGGKLADTELVVAFGDQEHHIHTGRLRVNRCTKEPDTNRRYYAFQFPELTPDEMEKLRRLLSDLQRESLKQRLVPDHPDAADPGP